jgi:hypothetical protein
MATTAPAKRRPRSTRRAERIMITSDALTLAGVAAASAALFLRGWVHVNVLFAPRNPSGTGLLQRLGAEVDKQIAAIGEQEVNATISPTLWRYQSHAFQALFALLLLVAAGVLLARLMPRRGAALTRVGACLMSAAAAIVVAAAFVRIHDRIAALPERITAAMESNAMIRQSLALTTGTPQISGGPGWPMIVVAAGALLALIGALVSLIVALRRPGMAAILPRRWQQRASTRGAEDGDSISPAAVSNDGSAPDAHRDAPAV